jgi:hypothetical protein
MIYFLSFSFLAALRARRMRYKTYIVGVAPRQFGFFKLLLLELFKTMGGALKMNQIEGTLRWSGVTDAGLEVKFPLENSVYIPHGDTRIFSPQNWSQNMLKLHPNCKADDRMRDGKEFIISWKLDTILSTITMPIDPHRNVAHIYVDMPDDSYYA